ncbi:MAG: hypothetical protein ACI9XR_001517 [Flavobacterium sp.]
MTIKSNVAILLFAQTAKVESDIKFFATNRKKNLNLWNILNYRILKEIKKTKLDFFVFNENNQVGETFGERITAATQQVFDNGFEKVIVIGNDCLDLDAKKILNASQILLQNTTVLGPDNNGGTYLMGVSKSNFDSNAFDAISWQSKLVLKELQVLFKDRNLIGLEVLNDFNSSNFFKFNFKRIGFSNLLKHLLQICIFELNFIFNFQKGSFFIYFNSILFNKGSPESVVI